MNEIKKSAASNSNSDLVLKWFSLPVCTEYEWQTTGQEGSTENWHNTAVPSSYFRT